MKKLKEQTLNIRFTSDVYEKLKQLSEKLDCSCGWIIRQAVNDYLEKLEKKDEQK